MHADAPSRLRPLATLLLAALLGLVASLPASAGAPCTDTTAPDLVIDAPERRSVLLSGTTDPLSVAITGTASDAESAIVSIRIDDVEQLASPGGLDESFSTSHTSRWGLNVILARAEDACGNVREIVHSYLRSGDTWPAATGPDAGALASDALVVQLHQGAFDDARSFANDALATLNLNSVVPTTLDAASLPECDSIGDNWATTASRVRVRRGTISASTPTVGTFAPRTGAVRGSGSISSVSMPVTLRAYNCAFGGLITTDFSATLSGSSIAGTVDFAPSVAGESFALSPTVVSSSGNVSISFSCGVLQAVCNLVTSSLDSLVTNLLRDAAEDLVEDALGDLLDDLLNDFDIGNAIDLPPPLGGAIGVRSPADSVSASDQRLKLTLAGQIYPFSRGADIPAGAPGALRRDIPAPDLPPDGTDLIVGLRDEIVNQLLWALWYGGSLDLPDLRSLAKSQDLKVEALEFFAHLPPVVMPGATADTIDIGIGDLEIVATVDLAEVIGGSFEGLFSVEFLVSSIVTGALEANTDRQKLTFTPSTTTSEVEILDADDGLPRGLLVILLEDLANDLMGGLAEGLVSSLPLPAVPAASLGGTPGFAVGLGNATTTRVADATTFASGDFASVPLCGDALIRGGEACDDGNRASGDGCSDECQVEPRFDCNGAQPTTCVAWCGNGALDPEEECDDGATDDGDGCDACCDIERGWACEGDPSSCEFLCGNGVLEGNEECDDGGLALGDGCDAFCESEPGYTCTGEPSTCEFFCGDGILDAGEDCDDGNSAPGDGCNEVCQVELGFDCGLASPSLCEPIGVRLPGTKVRIKNAKPDDPTKVRLSFLSKDKALPAPFADSSNDPRCSAPAGGGALLQVASDAGEAFAQMLPCELWSAIGRDDAPKGYRYRDRKREAGPCKNVEIRDGKRVKVSCKGSEEQPFDFDLEPGTVQTAVHLTLQTGQARTYCAEFADGVRKDGTDGRQFKAQGATAPTSCP